MFAICKRVLAAVERKIFSPFASKFNKTNKIINNINIALDNC